MQDNNKRSNAKAKREKNEWRIMINNQMWPKHCTSGQATNENYECR